MVVMNFILEEMEKVGVDGVDFVPVWFDEDPSPIIRSYTKEEFEKEKNFPKSNRKYWKMIDGRKEYIIAKYVIDLDSLIDCIDFLCEGIAKGEEYVSISNLKKFIQKFPKEELAVTLETFERLIKIKE